MSKQSQQNINSMERTANLIKICSARFIPNKEIGMPQGSAAALYQMDALWPQKSVILVSFQSPGKRFINISPQAMSRQTRQDPLQRRLEQDGAGNDIENIIKTVFKERYEKLTNLQFEFLDEYWDTGRSNRVADIRISFEPGGAWSMVGTQCRQVPVNKPTMNFGWLDVGTIIHEIGHAVGLMHEHQNPKGGIKWDREALYRWGEETQNPPWDKKMVNDNILNISDQTNGSVYDPFSVMLYFFPGYVTKDNKGSDQNLLFSIVDAVWLNCTYPKNAIQGDRGGCDIATIPTTQTPSAAVSSSGETSDPIGFLRKIYGSPYVNDQLPKVQYILDNQSSPKVTLPDITLPDITLPDITLPDITQPQPNGEKPKNTTRNIVIKTVITVSVIGLLVILISLLFKR